MKKPTAEHHTENEENERPWITQPQSDVSIKSLPSGIKKYAKKGG